MPRTALPLCVALLGSIWSTSSVALTVDLADFAVSRNGVAIFDDSFDDGLPPPSAPNFASGATASYVVFGSFPAGSEAAGLLTLDTSNGALTSNAGGQARRTLSATLATAAASSGLGADDTLTAQGLFDLATPPGPLYNGYGIQFTDANAGVQHQLAQLQVRFNPVSGIPVISYQFQDFDAGSISVLGQTAFTPPSGADQILLQISRPDVGSTDFFGSFQFLAGGSVVGSGNFAAPAMLFDGEDYVRARFFASAAVVPEPGTLALFTGGLIVIGGLLGTRRGARRG